MKLQLPIKIIIWKMEK